MHNRTCCVHQKYRCAVSENISNWISTFILSGHYRYSGNAKLPQRPKFPRLTDTIMVPVYPYLQIIVREIAGLAARVSGRVVFEGTTPGPTFTMVNGPGTIAFTPTDGSLMNNAG